MKRVKVTVTTEVVAEVAEGAVAAKDRAQAPNQEPAR